MTDTTTYNISLKQIDTPIGPMCAAATKKGICLLEFADKEERIAKQLKALKCLLKDDDMDSKSPHLAILEKQLKEYFAGKQQVFDVPVHLVGTKFQLTVWKNLQRIPFGSTLAYKQLAADMNKAEAVRAVGHANGTNRLNIIIPCHRLIGNNGKLTGYGGDLWRKKWLLKHENPTPSFPFPTKGAE